MVWCGILWVAVVWQGRVSHFTALFTAWCLRHSCDMHSSVEPDTVIVVLCYSDMYSTSLCIVIVIVIVVLCYSDMYSTSWCIVIVIVIVVLQ